MIVSIDIGGTKTLIASADKNGQILNKSKFPTPQDYNEFVLELTNQAQKLAGSELISIISIAVPGRINRKLGIIEVLGNLPWKNKTIISDVSTSLSVTKVIFENDANLAALSEANTLENVNQKILYITFSTGVGTGYVVNGILEPNLLDGEGGRMVLEHNGIIAVWESFASGKAIVEKYGKLARDLEDERAWREIARNMAIGIANNCAVFTPDTVIIGGSVGAYFYKYEKLLLEEMSRLIPMQKSVPMPKIVGAKNPEEAVILGCIILARQYE
jgi:predicted NBD/HSP70 family sugar kinase